jgi:hypothetical protein
LPRLNSGIGTADRKNQAHTKIIGNDPFIVENKAKLPLTLKEFLMITNPVPVPVPVPVPLPLPGKCLSQYANVQLGFVVPAD